MKQNDWKTYALWIVGTEAVGGLSGWLTRKGADTYARMTTKPPLTPPAAVFPVVWGILFARRCGQSVAAAAVSRPHEGIGAVRHSAGLQFFLEHPVFQRPGLWTGAALAGGAVGADFVDDSELPQNRPAGRLAAGALPAVGELCGLSQFRCVGAELKRRGPAFRRRPPSMAGEVEK